MKWSYDELVKLGLNFKSGSTNQKFKTIISDNNTKEINKQILPEDIVNSFKNSEYKTLVTLDDIILYRFVTSEPLMDYPEYTVEKPDEIRKNKSDTL